MRSELSPTVVILFSVPYISALCCSFFRHAPLSAAFYCPRRRRNNSVKCARFLLATFYRFRILSLSSSSSLSTIVEPSVRRRCYSYLLEINAACSAAQFLCRAPEEANFNHRYYSLWVHIQAGTN
jgi:hypothetical protein